MFTRNRRPGLFLASALSLGCLSGAALAQDSSSQLNSIEKQIRALQGELHRLKAEAAERDRELRAARATPAPVNVTPVMPNIPAGYALVPAAPGSTPGSVVLSHVELPSEKKLPQGAFQVGGVTVTFGGFLEGASIFRSRNEVTDITSSFTTGIPLRNSQLYHEPEFGESARRTTVQALADAKPDEVTDIEAFVQNDFQGGAPTSNENQSNAFIPRLVQAWAEYTRSDLGLTVLAGQSWSLLTMTQVGINPLRVNNPQTIDGNYVPGFTWTRQPQFRVGKSFDNDTYWLALSIENPQTVYANTTYPTTIGTVNFSNPGNGSLGTPTNTAGTATGTVTTTTTKLGGKTVVSSVATTSATGLASQGAYTNNFAPDIIAKATADYPFAHLEAYGLARLFNDRVSTLGHGVSDTVWGGGGGADALVHLIPHYLDFQVSGLAGQGIGRYGTSQLPDATIGPNGQPVPLREWAALAGLLGHPTPQLDVYTFFGTEQGTQSAYYNTMTKGVVKAYGYANPLYANTSCDVELGASADCTGTTKATVQGTVGAWWKFLKGSYGTMQVGAQYSYTRRFAWQGVGPTPQSDENMVFLSLRYYPFQ